MLHVQKQPMFGGRPILWQENSNGLSHVKRKKNYFILVKKRKKMLSSFH